MPAITFIIKDVHDVPVSSTEFVITAGFPDGGFDPEMELPEPVTIATDVDGEFTVTLPATGGPYFLSKAGNTVTGITAYKFFVPDVPGPLTASYLYVDLGIHQRLLNDASLLNLIETKVAVSNSLGLLESYLANVDPTTAEEIATAIVEAAVIEVNAYADTAAGNAEQAANDYTDTTVTAAATAAETAAKSYADGLVIGLWDDRGNFSAAGGAYPSSGGSGTAGAVKKGDIWTISVGGTLPTGQAVEVGDTVRALSDSPGNTQANWAIAQNNVGYTPENSANKSNDITLASDSTSEYPTVHAAKGYTDAVFGNIGSLPLTTVDRVTHFQNGTGSTTSLFSQNGYNQIAGNSVNLTQTIGNGVSGYAKAVGAAWIVAGTTSANYVAGVVRNIVGTSAFGQTWTAGVVMQTILYGSLMGYLPDGSNDIEYRYGLFYDGYYNNALVGGHAAYATDPFASIDASSADGAAAYFYHNNVNGFWVCKSGSDTNSETTITGVSAAINVLRAFRIKVGTTGIVEFWIDGTLVATHSGNGVITAGKQLSEAVVTMHKGSVASGSTHGWMIASLAFRQSLPSARTGFTFV